MRLLVCGDREWRDRAIIKTVLGGALVRSSDLGERLVVIEGCARGADTVACEWCPSSVEHEHYPANWEAEGKAAGPIRNRRMLQEGRPTVVVAFHDDLEHSKGTKDMVTIAKAANVPTYVVSHA